MRLLTAIWDCIAWCFTGPTDVELRSQAASRLAKAGHQKRRETEAEKRLRVHTELAAYVTAKRSQVAS